MPKISVKENWSGRYMAFKPPWTARRVFTVTGPTSDSAALTAKDDDDDTAIPLQLEEHPETSVLTSMGPEIVEKKGPDFYVIQVNYEFDDGKIELIPDDPYKKPVDYTWEHVEVSESVDIDLDGRPILTPAGNPIDGGGTRPVTYKKLHVVRNEPSWNLAKNKACENAVNNKAITLGNGVTVDVEHMRCVSIIPDGKYNPGFRFLPIHYTFEIIFDDSLGKFPFQHRFLGQDTQGSWDDSGTKRAGKWSDGKGTALDQPVLLGPTGLPLPARYASGSVMVGSQTGDHTPATPREPVAFYFFEQLDAKGGTTDDLDATRATIIYYKKTRLADFSVLGL